MNELKLENCPFCGAELEVEWPTVASLSNGRWVVQHYCPHRGDDLGVTISVYGSSKKEAVSRWNKRCTNVN